jgi:cytochrome c
MVKLFFSLFIGLSTWLGFVAWPLADPEKPDSNRFTKVILAEGLDEPMEMAFLPGNKIIVVERKGGVKIIDEKTKEVTDAGFITVNTKYTNKKGVVREAEEGLMGVSLDPNFKVNNWVYLYYAFPKEPKHVLSRFVLKDDALVMESEKIMLEVKTQREECCHTGGGMTWDKANNLFLTVGNNTVNPRQGSSNLVETPGLENEDDQRAPGNTNDLRGKILRIHPEPNGTYTIPKGNLFPVGTEKTRPEIYTMGHRNAWRPTLDSKTGFLYWGEVGPDATKDSTWGPKGYDEFNQAKAPGFFGWPYFIGNNKPYKQYNSADGTYGQPFDVNNPVNNSVNNTGLKQLPKPVPAMIYYPYGPSEEFPLVGTSGRSATGGPVFRAADFKNAPRAWPAYYEGKWLITDFMRGWIMAVTMDNNGDYLSMERVLPEMNFSSAIDMDFGPSGDMYVLEYGSAWFRGNDNSKLVKIEYNAGNRKPVVNASADVQSGSIPLKVRLSARGTVDYDVNDKLSYKWIIKDATKKILTVLVGENQSYTFGKTGNFTATLEVSDSKGAKNSKTITIAAGNTAPHIDLTTNMPNRTFYFGKEPIQYQIKVADKEDGTTENKIKAEEVAVTFDYLPLGYDPILMASNQKGADDMASFAVGRNLIEASDCKSCHQYTSKSIGPSYVDVAKKYKKNTENMTYLVKKIREGGSGVWGEHGMSAHPDLNEANAKRMVDYIFSFDESQANLPKMALSGTVQPEIPKYENGKGSFVLRAAYKDKGAQRVKSLRGESVLHLRLPNLRPQDLDVSFSTQVITTPGYSFSLVGDGAYAGYKQIDLSAINEVVAYVQASARNGAVGGQVELHLDSPSGPLVGTSVFVGLKELGFGRPPEGVSPEEWNRQRSGQAKISLNKKYEGKHDIYFVFKNDKAKKTDVILQLMEVGFYL